MANYVTYPLNTSGRPDGTPPVADKEGGYYYKYSYSWTSKAASTEVNLCDAIMKFDSSKNNNGYIFLSCVGTTSTPPEFGIYTAPEFNGAWKCYTREAGSGSVVPHETIFVPTGTSGGVYTYGATSSNPNPRTRVKMRIKLNGTNIIGQILDGNTVLASYTVSGAAAGIGESASLNTFLLGTSFVPNPPTTSCGNRDAYLKHVYLHEGYLYETNSYGNPTEWVPDPANPVTYYSIVVRPEYTTYNRFGSRDEEVSIDYN